MKSKSYSKSSTEMTPEFLKILYEMGEGRISVEDAFSDAFFYEIFEKIMVKVDSENPDNDFDKPFAPKNGDSKLGNIFRIFLNMASNSEFDFGRSLLPSKVGFADAILLFVCKPDDAEVAVGDLFEELEKVQSRHEKWYCNFWFFWELFLLVILKGRKRLTKSALGPLVDLWKRKSG